MIFDVIMAPEFAHVAVDLVEDFDHPFAVVRIDEEESALAIGDGEGTFEYILSIAGTVVGAAAAAVPTAGVGIVPGALTGGGSGLIIGLILGGGAGLTSEWLHKKDCERQAKRTYCAAARQCFIAHATSCGPTPIPVPTFCP